MHQVHPNTWQVNVQLKKSDESVYPTAQRAHVAEVAQRSQLSIEQIVMHFPSEIRYPVTQTPQVDEFWQVPQLLISQLDVQVLLSAERVEYNAQVAQAEEVAQTMQFFIWQMSLTQLDPFSRYPNLH